MDRPRPVGSVWVTMRVSVRLAGAAKRMNPLPKFAAFCTNTWKINRSVQTVDQEVGGSNPSGTSRNNHFSGRPKSAISSG
jgi:hypothetical protein